MEAKGAFITFLFGFLFGGTNAASFEFANNCTYTVWVGTLSGAGSPPLPQTGFQLLPSSFISLPAPPSWSSWSGRFWARTHCSKDPTGAFFCATGNCPTGHVSCDDTGAQPPATLAEITLSPTNKDLDFYDISLVDGYNVPVSVGPVGGGEGDCRIATCPNDVNLACPEKLKVVGANGTTVACRSACEALGRPEFCCVGDFGSPAACGPSKYSKVFKRACPLAYSYAYDDPTSIFTCSEASGYAVTFCP